MVNSYGSKLVVLTVISAGLVCGLSSCASDNNSQASAGFVSLFNGKDLTGWQRHTGLPGHDGVCGKWQVIDGAIVGVQDPPGKGGFLTTLESFQDFELQLDRKSVV